MRKRRYIKTFVSIVLVLVVFVLFKANRTTADRKYSEEIKIVEPLFTLFDTGTEKVVDYKKYGEFSDIGAFDYVYRIKDTNGLAKAQGEGIDPNDGVKENPAYMKLYKEGTLGKSHWKHIGTDDPQADFFVWATAYKEDPGVRLYFTAKALENAGLYMHALKAYRAAMLLYPNSFAWNRSLTWTWLIAPVAWSQIINLTRIHPELELKLVDAYVKTETAIRGDPTRNRVAVTPGHFIQYTIEDRKRDSCDIKGLDIIERRGGLVSCVKYSNGQWALEVDGEPFIVRGINYAPTRIGKDYTWNWMESDINRNGLKDVAYETWVDKNRNNIQDDDEPAVGDFRLLKEMGCNTIRLFNTLTFNKELLRDLAKTYGIKVFICDPLGAYTIHSEANWSVGTDYNDPAQRMRMKRAVRQTVLEYKNENWLLGYILGNENNMSINYKGVNATRTQAANQPKTYAEFLNEIAGMIHELDPEHPVGVGNLGLGLVEYYALYAPELDLICVNDYPGSYGFGSLWIQARTIIDRPILITEFGCDAYATEEGIDESAQAFYHKNGWEDIMYNTAGAPGEGNAVGGIVFEWLDEWWKDTREDSLYRQNTEPTFEMAYPDGWSQEEWLGIIGQGDGKSSPFLRALRKAYFVYKGMWRQ